LKEWYRALVITLLEQSPSQSLRQCAFLGGSLFHMAEHLFNSAFVAIWRTLSDELRTFVSGALADPLLREALPGGIRCSIVNLIDFLERTDHRMEFPKQMFCRACARSSQFAKGMYIAHRWFEEEPHNIEAVERLIQFSVNLGLNKTIAGISNHLQKDPQFARAPLSCEKLGQWSLALEVYQSKPPSPGSMQGILKCLMHLHRWDDIISQLPEFEELPANNLKTSMAAAIATALFHRHQWDKLRSVLEYCPRNSVRILMITALY
jgi:hypothetical protein